MTCEATVMKRMKEVQEWEVVSTARKTVHRNWIARKEHFSMDTIENCFSTYSVWSGRINFAYIKYVMKGCGEQRVNYINGEEYVPNN